MRTLITGFGPFGTVAQNPSGRLAETSGRPFEVLDVSFEAVDRFLQAVDSSCFDRLLMIGVAAKRVHMNAEIFARNYVGRAKDVRGESRFGFIDPKGPLLISSTLWTPELVGSLFPLANFHASEDAGNYLCNYISYCALRRLVNKQVGFLHIPTFDEIPEVEQSVMLQAILAAVESVPTQPA